MNPGVDGGSNYLQLSGKGEDKIIIRWVAYIGLIVLQIPSASPTAQQDVYPAQGNGFAAQIVPALVAVAVLALFAIWLSSKPRRRRKKLKRGPS